MYMYMCVSMIDVEFILVERTNDLSIPHRQGSEWSVALL